MFACATVPKETIVSTVPVYHFHDGFLKFTELMKGRYPNRHLSVELEDNGIEQRFYKATLGWVKYKPLYFYITDRENYRQIIDNSLKCLEQSVDIMSKQFATCNFRNLISELKTYDKNVKIHYKEYLEVNRVWDKIKFKIGEEN